MAGALLLCLALHAFAKRVQAAPAAPQTATSPQAAMSPQAGSPAAASAPSQSPPPLDAHFKGKLPISELTKDEAILHALNRLGYGRSPARWRTSSRSPRAMD